MMRYSCECDPARGAAEFDPQRQFEYDKCDQRQYGYKSNGWGATEVSD